MSIYLSFIIHNSVSKSVIRENKSNCLLIIYTWVYKVFCLFFIWKRLFEKSGGLMLIDSYIDENRFLQWYFVQDIPIFYVSKCLLLIIFLNKLFMLLFNWLTKLSIFNIFLCYFSNKMRMFVDNAHPNNLLYNFEAHVAFAITLMIKDFYIAELREIYIIQKPFYAVRQYHSDRFMALQSLAKEIRGLSHHYILLSLVI